MSRKKDPQPEVTVIHNKPVGINLGTSGNACDRTMIEQSRQLPKMLLLLPLIGLTLIAFFYLLFISYYQERFYPGLYIASYKVGGQTPTTVKRILDQSLQNKLQTPLKFQYNEQTLELNLKDASVSINLDEAIDRAYLTGRSGNYLLDIKAQAEALIFNLKATPKVSYLRPTALIYQINNLNQLVKKEPQDARLTLGEEVILTPSQEGQEIDSKPLLAQIDDYLLGIAPAPTTLPVKSTAPHFTTEDAQIAKGAVDNLQEAPMRIHYQSEILTVNQIAFFNMLNLQGKNTVFLPGISDNDLSAQNLQTRYTLINKDKLAKFLEPYSQKIYQEAKDARFVFNPDTKRVSEFQQAQEGREIDLDQTLVLLTQAALAGSPKDLDLPVKVTQPKILTADVNSFGISQLLGKGISNFSGSIDNRIYNVGLAASRTNGVLVAPGEVFSFNKTVGDVSGATGYKQAYVIKSGRTVLDDGGGVCQVSTTLFRAVLNAGLPVVDRIAHAYRVGYYEQGSPPGLDATVFSPSVDFKFKNDTPGYILVQSRIQDTSLTFEIYGTSDGRLVNVTTPRILSQTPPLPEIRQDDPNLPKGTIKQVDWPAWGANVVFERTVTRNGETLINEAFKSNYRPWQAVYLVGTKEN